MAIRLRKLIQVQLSQQSSQKKSRKPYITVTGSPQLGFAIRCQSKLEWSAEGERKQDSEFA